MGWFPTNENDDMIGDLPADIIQMRLTEYCGQWSKPTLDELLAALEQVLRNEESRYLDPDTAFVWPIGHLTCRNMRKRVPTIAATELINCLRGMMDGINQVYEDGLDRKPRLTEILAALVFTLQGNTCQLLANAERLKLRPGDLIEVR